MEAPPSIQEYDRRRQIVSELAEEANRLALAAYRVETAVGGEAAASIDGKKYLMRSIPRSSSRVVDAKKRAADARQAADDAMVELNSWSAEHREEIWPPDPLNILERAKVERDRGRREQLAEDLRALGFTVPGPSR